MVVMVVAFYLPGVLMCFLMSYTVVLLEPQGWTRQDRVRAVVLLCGGMFLWPVLIPVWWAHHRWGVPRG